MTTINNININSNDFDFLFKIIKGNLDNEEEGTWRYYKLSNMILDLKTESWKARRIYGNIEQYSKFFKQELTAVQEFFYLDYMRNITKKMKGDDIIHSFNSKSVKDCKKEYRQILKLCTAFEVPLFS